MDVRICWEGWKEWLCHCDLFVPSLILLLECNLMLFCSLNTYSVKYWTQGKGRDAMSYSEWAGSDIISFMADKVATYYLTLFWDVETLWGLLTSPSHHNCWSMTYYIVRKLGLIMTDIQCRKFCSSTQKVQDSWPSIHRNSVHEGRED